MKKWLETKVPRRLLSLAVCAAMVFSLLPVFAFAEEGNDGLCQHHTEHTPECGYVEAVAGQDCTHVCGDECFTLTTACTHVHGAACYSDGVLPAEGEEKTADACAHECTEESGCVTKTPACVHTAHDETCGYVEAVAGQPCNFVCEECAGEESKPTEPTEAQPEEKVITDWEWVDEWEIIDPDSGKVLLPFASAERIAWFDDIVSLLPTAITADSEELTLGQWTCEAYPVETGAYEGAYSFQTTLPEGFVLDDGANVLHLTVVLGDPEGAPAAVLAITPAEPPKGTYTINGTERTDVYALSTAAHLYWFANEVTNNWNTSINAILMNDITVNSGVLTADGSLNTSGSFESWTPIGDVYTNHDYSGTFDGNGYTISGLYVNDATASYIGLFGSIDSGGTVVNVKIADSYFAGKNNIGGVCGRTDGTVSGCYSSGSVTGSDKVGGVCGYNYGTVSGCYSSGTVSGSSYVGGVCGISSIFSKINNCYSSGSVTGSGNYVGGVCGYNAGTVSGCMNSGTVTGSSYVGGVCGHNINGTVSNCYFDSTAYAGKAIGGSSNDTQDVCGKSPAEFASGEVAYLLNGSTSEGTLVWYQNIDKTGVTRDPYPQFSGATVYKTSEASPCQGYSNTPNLVRDHSNNPCTYCGHWETVLLTVSGITAKDKTYDGNTTAELDFTNALLANVQSTYPNVTVTATGTFADANVGQDKTVNISDLTLTGADASKYRLADSGQQASATASITPKSITVTITPNGGTYGGTITPAAAVANDLVGSDQVPVTLTYSGTANDGTVVNGADTPTLAGAYTVTATISNSNYQLTGTTTAQFVINKATVPTPTVASKVYNGGVQTADIFDTDRYTVTTNNGGTDTGSYRVELTLTDGNNYQWDNAGGVTAFQITKAASNRWTTDPAISGWTYGDTPSTPSAAAEFGTVKVEYTSDGTTYSETAPSKAGDYTARFTVADTSNFVGLSAEKAFTISPKSITVTITPNGGTYGGTITPAAAVANDLVGSDQVPVTLTYSGTANDGTEVNGTTAVPTHAGTYTVTATISNSNYQLTGTTTAQFVIDKATVPTPTVASKVYNGGVQTADISNTDRYTVTTNDGGTDVGSYRVELTLTDGNNYQWDGNSGVTAFQITKATSNSWTTEPAISGWTYGNTPSTPVGAAQFGTVKVEYTSDGTTYSETAPTNAGDYTARFTVAETSNFGGLSAEKAFTIKPKSITVTITPNGGTYGNVSPATAELNGVVSGETVPVTLTYTGTANDGTMVNGTAVPTHAGTYTVTASISDSNYRLTGVATAEFVIDKAAVTTPTVASKVYNGSVQTADISNTERYTVTTNNGGTDTGSYTVELTLTDSDNYKWDTAGGVTAFQITKATSNSWTTEPAISGWTYGDTSSTPVGAAQFGTVKVEYTSDGNTYSETAPTKAGDYKARFTVAETNNFVGLSAEKTFTIAKREVTLNITIRDKTFDDSTTAEINTVNTNDFVSGDDVRVVNGTPSFTRKTPGEHIPVSFTDFTLEGGAAGNYHLAQPTGVTGRILPTGNYLDLTNNPDFTGHTEVWVDGVRYPIQTEDGRYVNLSEEGGLLTIYTYQQGSAHEKYPTGMAVYRIDRQASGAAVAKIDALDDLLQYSGCSIRVTGNRGIRMITSLTKGNKSALTGAGLAGYTLEEYGTVVQWADTLGDQSLTLATGKHNYAYKKGVADPVFATSGDLTQYTNVLVWDSLTDAQLGKDIVMRPYIILRDGSGNTVTLYGGCVSRSIGYIAYQNRAVFNPGTAAYKYVWDILHAVYGDQYDSEYKG